MNAEAVSYEVMLWCHLANSSETNVLHAR